MSRRRWEIWIWTCIYALLPLILWWVVAPDASLAPGVATAESARQICYFAITVCVISLAELRDPDGAAVDHPRRELLSNLSVVFIILSASLFGRLVHRTIVHGVKAPVVAGVVAALALFVSTCSQIITHPEGE